MSGRSVALFASCILCGGGARAQQATSYEAAAPAAAAPHFDVFEYRVIGNTSLPNTAVERSVYGFLGPGKTIADVELARQSLEHAYRDAGFGSVFVDIPEQQVDQGVVRLHVTEGRLDRVRITGARYFANGQIRAALPALASGSVLNVPALQAQLAEVNRVTADRSVVPVLKAGRSPGTVDAELKVNDRLPLHGSLELNDRYTAGTAHQRLTGSLSYGNLFGEQHSLSLQYQTAPQQPSKVQVEVATYVFRLPSWPRTTWAVYGVNSDSDVAAVGTLSVIGKGKILGARIIHSLAEAASYSQNLTWGVDYKDFLENIRLTSATSQLTPMRYLNWSLVYGTSLRHESGTTDFSIGANFGVRGLINSDSEFNDKRFAGRANYAYLRGTAQHVQNLPWKFQLYGRATGQITQDPLVSNEQFALGGADTIRGYLESSQLGDYGVNGTIELRQGFLSTLLQTAPGTSYLEVFYDSGVVAIYDALPSQQARQQLASWGAGLRIGSWHGFDLSLDWADVLKTVGATHRGDKRTHFDFRFGF